MDSRIIKVLYVNGGIMDRGGVSSVMMNYFLHFDHEIIHVDFLVHGNKKGERDDEIISRGSKIYRVPPKSNNLLKNRKSIKQILKNESYDIVHSHADSGNAYILKIAQECGIRIRISHSHNTGYTIHNRIRILCNELQKKQVAKYATALWACSEKAGKWLYGDKLKFEVIHNAIELEKYRFNVDKRKTIREELGISDYYVIGNVGRLDYQKNQQFLIKVFAEIQDSKKCLVIVGEGQDREQIENLILECKQEDKVLLLGQRSDVNDILNVFDVFALPSNFEGLGIVAIEAQANGLYCLCSDQVPDEVAVSEKIEFIPLEYDQWKEKLNGRYNRNTAKVELLRKKGYDIVIEAEKMQNTYISMVKKNENIIYN